MGGGGASCPGWFILPPAQDLGQAVSSVNSYCTIILEYLIVRDINIISVTEMFTSNIQFGYPCPKGGGQAVQAALSCESGSEPLNIKL